MPREKTPELEALGNALRQLRQDRHLSQERLGQLSSTHRNYLGGVERAELNPTALVLFRIAGALDVPLSQLIELAERYLTEGSSND